MILQKTKIKHLEIVILGLILLGMFVFSQSELFVSNLPIFSKALAFDLLVGIPIIYYILQNKLIPDVGKMFKIFTVCLFVSTLLIPESNIASLSFLQEILYPMIKTWIAYKVVQKLILLIKEYRKHSFSLKGYDLIATTIENSFKGKLSEILKMEFNVIYFLLAGKRSSNYEKNEFGYTEIKGTVEMVCAFIFIIVIETVVAHILISKFNPIIAIVCSYSSLYLVILFISILRSRKHFPIIVEDGILRLRYGYINNSTVKFSDIKSIELSRKSNNNELMKLSAFKGVENHNIIIHFNCLQIITKVFGIQKEYESIGLYVDKPELLLKQVNYQLQKREPDGNKL